MSTDNNPDYKSLLTLLESGLVSPKELVEAINMHPISIDYFDDGDLKLADEHQTDIVLSALEVYKKECDVKLAIAIAKNELVSYKAEKKEKFNDHLKVLSWFGWDPEDSPKFSLAETSKLSAELPKLHTLKLATEGRFVEILMTEAGIDIAALKAGDKVAYKQLKEMSHGQIDPGTLANMLERWGLREKKSKSSSK